VLSLIFLIGLLVMGVSLGLTGLNSTAFAEPLPQGFSITAPITLTSSDGNVSQVSCRYRVLPDGTLTVIGDNTLLGGRAVALTTRGSITIPSIVDYSGESYTVTQIGNFAFGGDSTDVSCTQLTSVILPSTLTQIGTRAFAYNNGLTSLALPEGLEVIGERAFYYCTGLSELVIPASVVEMKTYAFCRCTGLRSVEFLGDAPVCGNYVFTGGAMDIRTVLYHGARMANQEGLYNGENLAVPAFYYTIRFYASLAARDAQEAPLGSALIRHGVPLYKIDDALDPSLVYRGTIPVLPQGCNLWMSDVEGKYMDTGLDNSHTAYATWSDFRDLSTGSFAIADMDFTGSPVDFRPQLTCSLGFMTHYGEKKSDTENHPRHFVMSYYRQAEGSGTWQATGDLIAPGTVRVVATGTGDFHGSIATNFTIAITTKTPFQTNVPFVYADGTKSSIPCFFQLAEWTGSASGRVIVVKDPVPFGRAISTSAVGELTIPALLDVYGNAFTPFSIANSAFGYTDEKNAGACRITRITLPTSMTGIGSLAFATCSNLDTVVFEGNASSIGFGVNVFVSTTALKNVVYKAKKESITNLFPSKPTCWYTVTFYNDDKVVDTTQGILGRITIRDDVPLAILPNLAERTTGAFAGAIWSGAVPAYPTWVTDDGHWYAPTWNYNLVKNGLPVLDMPTMLRSSLNDSLSAYAKQTNDAYTIDDAIVYGLLPGQVFEYANRPVINLAEVIICGPMGGVLTEGTDYTVGFLRLDRQGNWGATTDVSEPGSLRCVLTGQGRYANTLQTIAFTINILPAANGYVFKKPITLIAQSGTEGIIDCQFQITSAVLGEETVTVYSAGMADTAVATTAAGTLVIPSTINYGGVVYKVTAISQYAFGNTSSNSTTRPVCVNLTEVVIPDSVTTIGSYAFAYMTNLQRLTLPVSLEPSTCGSYIFAYNSNLRTLTFPEGITALPSNGYWFSGSSLQDIVLPSTLRSIGSGFFSSSRIQKVRLPGGLVSWTSAFSGCTLLSEVILEEGITSIPEYAFNGCTALKTLTIPSTVTSIGRLALAGSGLTRITLPRGVLDVGANAFSSCSSLSTVIFEGDVTQMLFDYSFNASYNITTVVFMAESSTAVRSLFNTVISATDFYYRVTFYASDAALAAGTSLGQAVVRESTKLSSVTSTLIPTGAVFSGAVPAWPGAANFWEFEDSPPMNSNLTGSTNAVARQIDYYDLAWARFQFSDGYRYTGAAIEPLRSERGALVSPAGEVLVLDTHYTASFERQDGAGDWQASNDITTRGRIRVTASAAALGGYSGEVRGVYTISSYLAGNDFTAVEPNGATVSYRVLSIGDDQVPATVQVGLDSRSIPAVAANTQGVVALPATVRDPDPDGLSYEVARISDYAFYRCMGITGMVVPSTVTSIGIFAFAYENVKTDTQTSNLATLVLDNDLSQTKVGRDAFLNCDLLTTVVFGSKKGSFNSFGPNTATLTRYYTVRYYDSLDDFKDGILLARVILKQGSYIFSPSAIEFFGGITGYAKSDELPPLAVDHEWRYESRVMGDDLTMVDSLYAYQRVINDNSVTADVVLRTGSGGGVTETPVSCTFDVLLDEDEEPTGFVRVGTAVDGSPAVNPALTGTLVIPATIHASDGVDYTVSAVGSFAFGSTVKGDACALTGIELPATVSTLDQAAFLNCSTLALVRFAADSTLTSIGASALAGTTALQGIELPASLTALQTAAFEQSGLRSIKLPFGLETLGKRAFNSCASLAEVVFGGIDPLELPSAGTLGLAGDAGVVGEAEDALPLHAAAPASTTDAAARLTLIDDYCFANCPALTRIVFDSDVSALVGTRDAFENTPNITDIVYASGHAELAFSDASPVNYLTVSYYDNADALAALVRSSYVCVREGTVLKGLKPDSEQIYAGAIPAAEEHFEWAYSFVPSEPLRDSGTAVKQRVTYSLDTSGVDGAFELALSVDGEPVSEARYGDTVAVTLTQRGAVSATLLTMTGATSGKVLQSTAAYQTSFVMPGEVVRFSVTPAYQLSLARQSATGLTTEVASFNLDQLRALASTRSFHYSYWTAFGSCYIATVPQTIPLTTLFARYGLRFEQGDTLIFNTADSATTKSISWYELYGQPLSYYPYAGYSVTDDGQPVEPSLALSAIHKQLSKDDLTPEPAPSARPDMARAVQLLFGQTPSDLVMRTPLELQFFSGITRITVLSASFKMDTITASGLEPNYLYNGSEIRPEPVLHDSDGRLLIKDRDYELSYRDNVESGMGYIICSGMASYSGDLEVPFKILRAQSYAGEYRYQTAVQIALDAYPQGSNGAIIVSGVSFPDALSATALAGVLDYPIVLTESETLTADAEQALLALSANSPFFQTIIVGGESAVSDSVAARLAELYGSMSVARVSDMNRYSTSLEVLYYGSLAGGWSDTVIVASGASFPDALSISPYAAHTRSPILLSESDTLSSAALDEIARQGFRRAIVVGGTSALSDGVVASLAQVLGPENVERLSGENRYSTSLAIARYALATTPMQAHGVGIATGQNFPDALAGGVLLGRHGAPLILADPEDTSTYALLDEQKDAIQLLRFLGGEGAVPTALRTQATDTLGWSREVLR
jgi:putative cell wall-binding protein